MREKRDTAKPEDTDFLNSIALPQDYLDAQVKERLTHVRIGRPKPQTFFRVHPHNTLKCMIIYWEEEGETYIIENDLVHWFINSVTYFRQPVCVEARFCEAA